MSKKDLWSQLPEIKVYVVLVILKLSENSNTSFLQQIVLNTKYSFLEKKEMLPYVVHIQIFFLLVFLSFNYQSISYQPHLLLIKSNWPLMIVTKLTSSIMNSKMLSQTIWDVPNLWAELILLNNLNMFADMKPKNLKNSFLKIIFMNYISLLLSIMLYYMLELAKKLLEWMLWKTLPKMLKKCLINLPYSIITLDRLKLLWNWSKLFPELMLFDFISLYFYMQCS